MTKSQRQMNVRKVDIRKNGVYNVHRHEHASCNYLIPAEETTRAVTRSALCAG